MEDFARIKDVSDMSGCSSGRRRSADCNVEDLPIVSITEVAGELHDAGGNYDVAIGFGRGG